MFDYSRHHWTYHLALELLLTQPYSPYQPGPLFEMRKRVIEYLLEKYPDDLCVGEADIHSSAMVFDSTQLKTHKHCILKNKSTIRKENQQRAASYQAEANKMMSTLILAIKNSMINESDPKNFLDAELKDNFKKLKDVFEEYRKKIKKDHIALVEELQKSILPETLRQNLKYGEQAVATEYNNPAIPRPKILTKSQREAKNIADDDPNHHTHSETNQDKEIIGHITTGQGGRKEQEDIALMSATMPELHASWEGRIPELLQIFNLHLHLAIAKHQRRNCFLAGSTFTFVWFYKGELYTVWQGDSLALRLRKKMHPPHLSAQSLTFPHTLKVREHQDYANLERQRLQKEKITVKDDRVNGLAVSRSLGDLARLSNPLFKIASITKITPEPGDVITVATDGAVDHTSLSEILSLFLKNKNLNDFISLWRQRCYLKDPDDGDNTTISAAALNQNLIMLTLDAHGGKVLAKYIADIAFKVFYHLASSPAPIALSVLSAMNEETRASLPYPNLLLPSRLTMPPEKRHQSVTRRLPPPSINAMIDAGNYNDLGTFLLNKNINDQLKLIASAVAHSRLDLISFLECLPEKPQRKKAYAFLAITKFIDQMTTPEAVRQVITTLENNHQKINYIFMRDKNKNLSWSGQCWKNEDVSLTWINIINHAKEKIINLVINITWGEISEPDKDFLKIQTVKRGYLLWNNTNYYEKLRLMKGVVNYLPCGFASPL